MRDQTIEALDGIAGPDPIAARSAGIGDARERLNDAGAWGLLDQRAALLLFDILVGITIGTLSHRQAFWHTEVVETQAPPAGWDEPCGTFRCVAGWIVHVTNALAQPVINERVDGLYRSYERAYQVRLTPAAAPVDYDDAASSILGLLPLQTGSLFSGGADLPELWDEADRITGGTLTAPMVLRPLIEAGRR